MKRHKATRSGVDIICGFCGRPHSTVPRNNTPKKIICSGCKKEGPPKVQSSNSAKGHEPLTGKVDAGGEKQTIKG